MIVFTTTVARISVDRVVLSLRADGEPIGQLLLSPRILRAFMVRLFGDDEEGGKLSGIQIEDVG